MKANTFGNIFTITTFGESHGVAMGVVIDGCPAGVAFDQELLLEDLRRRRPGLHGKEDAIVSGRNEEDLPEVLSGVFEGKTIGTPIAIIVRNKDQRSEDYDKIKKNPRIGHADDVWIEKYGHVDYRGGGRSSGRETIARVMGGAVAKMVLKELAPDLIVKGFATQIGPIKLGQDEINCESEGWVPNEEKRKEIEELLISAKKEGESYGGIVEICVGNAPKSLGQPVFHKLKADLAHAIMGIGACISFELGDGMGSATAEGTQFHNTLRADQYGGIRGGISTGEKIVMRASFKPTATVMHEAKKGRHDPCIIPRAIPVIESMIYMVLLDHIMMAKNDRVDK
jgi:chorismate synthase